MLEIFKSDKIEHGTGDSTEGSSNYVFKVLKANLDKVLGYYRTRHIAVKNTNLLNRILYHIQVPEVYSFERVIEILRARCPYVAKTFNITSEIQYGKLHYGEFYGGCDEVLIYVEEDFDYREWLGCWWEMEPIKVLSHPRSDLTLRLPTGEVDNSEIGTCHITIDLVKLGFMYRCFLISEVKKAKERGDDVIKSSMQFIHMYVLSNLMKSHLEVVLFNRMLNMHLKREHGESYIDNAFFLSSIDVSVDKVLSYKLESLGSTTRNYTRMLDSMPSLNYASFKDFMSLPDYAETRQVHWAYLTLVMKYVLFMVSVGGINNAKMDLDELNKFKRRMLELSRDNALEHFKSMPYIYESVMLFIKGDSEWYKKEEEIKGLLGVL